MRESAITVGVLTKHKKLWVTIAAALVFAAVLVVHLYQPERSVAAYCSVRQAQRERLKNATGNAYSSALLPGVKSDRASDFADAMAKMERVAPEEVQPNIRVQRLAFEKVDKDPSQAIGAALGAMTSEENAKAWTEQHCGKSTN